MHNYKRRSIRVPRSRCNNAGEGLHEMERRYRVRDSDYYQRRNDIIGNVLLGSVIAGVVVSSLTLFVGSKLSVYAEANEKQFVALQVESVPISPDESTIQTLSESIVQYATVPEYEFLNTLDDSLVQSIPIVEEDIAKVEEEIPIEEAEPEEVSTTVIFPSVEYIKKDNTHTYTEEIEFDMESLLRTYNETYSISWDDKGTFNTIATIYDFLVNQMGVNNRIASAICGNTYYEGIFGMQQKTYYVASSLDSLYSLSKSDGGIGCVQWTSANRKTNLKNFYKAACEIYPDDFQSAKIMAELALIYTEIQDYKLFSNLNSAYSVENATGIVAVRYESYNGCELDFASTKGVYSLVRQNSNGALRLQMAYNIYKYFGDD